MDSACDESEEYPKNVTAIPAGISCDNIFPMDDSNITGDSLLAICLRGIDQRTPRHAHLARREILMLS